MMGAILAFPIAFIIGFICMKCSVLVHWVKSILSYIYVKKSKRNSKRRFDLYDYSSKHDPVKVAFLYPQEEYDLEGPQTESHLLKKEDELFFYGSNSKSEIVLVKINRHCSDRAEANVYVKLESGKVFHLEKTFDYQQSCTNEMTFSCGGLQLQCLSPMRSWRLFYAGYLREVSEDNNVRGKMVYVKFALLWKAASDVFDFESDISSRNIADGLSTAPWNFLKPPLNELQSALDFYCQAGTIHGTITIENEFVEKEMYLFGHRLRYLGSISKLGESQFYHVMGFMKKTGTYFHIGYISSEKCVKKFSFGFVVQSDTELKGMDRTSASIIEGDKNEKDVIKAKFSTDLFSYELFGSSTNFVSSNEITESSSNLKTLELYLNDEPGYGILFKRTPSKKIECDCYKTKKILLPREIPNVVSFKEDICQLPEVTGGKGSSLGRLTCLSENLQNFFVPDGVVVTTAAYSSFLTKPILNEIKLLEEISYKKNSKPDEVTKACKSVEQLIVNTEFPILLRKAIEEELKTHFKENIHSQKFAVRSSATGEDTEQMSAAGQMETFLGVSGTDEILLALKKCWASQFSFVASEYKRRYGQCYNSPMAVVIQEMVPCEVAGVLFTCDPLNGDPTLISVTANYGLGESVVSGSEEPDMITLKRDENDEFKIKSTDVGQKSRKIVIGETETKVEDVSENQRNVCSLSEEKIFQLGSVAIKIQQHYRSHRDIEWGFFNENLYIFQSRPVTSNSKETIHEIDHEFDCSMRVENDFYSVSNVGEVVPKAFSTLGLDMCVKGFKIVLNSDKKDTLLQLKGKTQYFSKGWLMMLNHFIFNVADVFPLKANEEFSALKKATIISFFGRVPDNKEMYDVSRARYGTIPEPSSLRLVLKSLLSSSSILKNTLEFYSKYRLPIEKYTTSKELFDGILYTCTDFSRASRCHMICTQASSILNMMIFSSLGAAHGDFDDIVYKDFAKLLKTHEDVESADVPSATQDIGFHIALEVKPEDFKRLSVEEALNWLQTSQSPAGVKFRKFLERHGHRCLQEFDTYSRPWRETPELLVKLLQTLVGSAAEKVTNKTPDDLNKVFSELNVPLGRIAKLFLKFIVPYARRGVQYREASKSLMVKCQDEWRKGWRSLSQMMVKEGRIPDEDLLFFMRLEDIDLLIKTRSPSVISKAVQRRKRWPILNEYRFPEIMKGFPAPIDKSDMEIVVNSVNFSMHGIPVSQGVAKGYARKAVTLEEAVDIKPGEILITYSTDIGWSPYFPHLAGVVTELGGLISHGAVVSREYGIPCIAGLHGATKQFQTGDYVILDGNRGILQKIEPPSE